MGVWRSSEPCARRGCKNRAHFGYDFDFGVRADDQRMDVIVWLCNECEPSVRRLSHHPAEDDNPLRPRAQFTWAPSLTEYR